MFFRLEQEGGSLMAPMAPVHPLHPIDSRSRNRRRNLWIGWCASSWWPLFPSRSSVLIYMYIYMYFLYELCYMTYIYIQQECHQYWGSCTPSHYIGLYFWGVHGSWVDATFCLVWFTNCVLLSDDDSVIPGCLWLLVLVLNNTLILGVLQNLTSQDVFVPGPSSEYQDIGFNMVPSDPFMSHPATQLGYPAGEFQALQLIVLVEFGVVDEPLASCIISFFGFIFTS